MNKRSKRRKESEQKFREYKRVLKDDHDWDYAFILRLLAYKLKRTRECIVKNSIVMSSSRIGKEIKQVEDLLHRVDKDRYYEEISKAHRKKYGTLKMLDGKKNYDKNGKSVSTEVVLKYSKETPRTRVRAHKEAMKLHRKADRMRVSDLKRAFRIMEKKMWGWWD